MAQAYQDLFARTYGGRSDDWAYSLSVTSDAGFVLAGYTRSFGSASADFLLVKTNFFGDPEWALTAGGPGSEYANAVIQTADGGFALAGYTRSVGAGGSDALVLKLRQDGELEWARAIGGTGNECAFAVEQLPDGSFLLAGYTTTYGLGGSDVFLFKLTQDGELDWARTVGGPGSESVNCMARTNEAGFLLAGYGHDGSDLDPLLVCVSPSGDLVWARSVAVAGGSYIRSAIPWTDGFLLAGWAKGKYGDPDALVVKISEKGEIKWARTFGGPGHDWASSLTPLPDGGFGVAGCISFGHYNFLAMRLSGSGELEWAKTFGSPGWDAASCIARAPDGRIAVAGYTSGFGIGGDDILLVELGPDGNYPGCVVDCPVRVRVPSVNSGPARVESVPCLPTVSDPAITIRKVPMGAVDVCAPPLEEPEASPDQ